MADEQQPTQQPQNQKPDGYGKRPMWQWLLIYLVVGAVVYLLVYLLFFRSSGSVY